MKAYHVKYRIKTKIGPADIDKIIPAPDSYAARSEIESLPNWISTWFVTEVEKKTPRDEPIYSPSYRPSSSTDTPNLAISIMIMVLVLGGLYICAKISDARGGKPLIENVFSR